MKDLLNAAAELQTFMSFDRACILEHLSPLCEFKEAPEIVARLQKLFRELCPPPSAD